METAEPQPEVMSASAVVEPQEDGLVTEEAPDTTTEATTEEVEDSPTTPAETSPDTTATETPDLVETTTEEASASPEDLSPEVLDEATHAIAASEKRPLRVLFLSDETGGGHRASAEALGKQVCCFYIFFGIIWYWSIVELN